MDKKEILQLIKKTNNCKNSLLKLSNEKIKSILLEISDEIIKNTKKILVENSKDLENFEKIFSKNHPNYDRLLLNETRINSIANDIISVVNFNFSTDKFILSEKKHNDLKINKISVPFGVICVIYESRPNVTVDVFSLCFRSQNCCILKGGEDAYFSNKIFVEIIKNTLIKNNLDENIVNLLTFNRKDTNLVKYLLSQEKLIDLCIPRGGKGLINFVRKYSKIPMIITGAGVVHLYLDEEFDERIAQDVIYNSKTRRVSVCNALDCLLVHKKSLSKLKNVLKKLAEKNVILYCDKLSYQELKNHYPFIENLKKNEIGKEFLDYKMSIITVSDVKQALKYITKYGSSHSDGIISSIKKNQILFELNVDSSVVYINTSTAFTDGAQFGLGSEIGISTQKMHARGPMGIENLRTTKYVVLSDGKIRDN